MHTALNQLKPKLNRKPHKKQIVPFFFTVNFQIAQLYFQDNKKRAKISPSNFATYFYINLFLKPQPLLSGEPPLSSCPNLKNPPPFHIFQLLAL